MAIVGSNVTKGSGTGTGFTSASVSPTSNNLDLLALSVKDNTGGTADIADPTLSGLGLTWVKINSVRWSTTSLDNCKIWVYRALGTVTPGTISITYATSVVAVWMLDQFSGIDTSGTNGSGAIVQSLTGQNNNSGSSLTITLNAFGNANNAAYGTFAEWNALTLSPEAGWSQLAAQAGADGNNITEYNPTQDNTVVGNFGSADNIGGIALEIKAATSTTTFPSWPILKGHGIWGPRFS